MPSARTNLRWAAAIAATVVVASIVVSLSASAQRPLPTLHEYLPPATGSAGRSDQVVSAPQGKVGALPDAIETAFGRIAAPKAAPPGSGAPLYEARPPASAGADRRTGGDHELHYQMVFDPEVTPFKREVALDRVTDDLRAVQSGAGNARRPVGGAPRPGHELFWGHVQVRLQPGVPVVLPSVAPTSQVLSWHAEPPVPLELWRDEAGNFTVRSTEPGLVDLRFLMDAPTDYFSAPLGVATADDDPDRPTLPPLLQAQAAALWPRIGVSHHTERGAAVARLVEWFRGFSPGEPPPSTGDALADLVLSKKGVCRHRALGFVVMAHSLGISAHFVQNDAHAFAEVWAPGTHGRGAWQRVDLGGGADSLELHGAQGKHLHQPLHADPFPKPEAYLNATARVLVDGAPIGQSWAGAGQIKGAEGMAQSANAGSTGVAGAGAGAGMSTAADQAGRGTAPQSESEARRAWLHQRAQALAAPPVPPGAQGAKPSAARAPCRLTIDAAAPMAWLGEPLALTGRVRCGAVAVGQLPIELWLIDPARPAAGSMLGVVATEASGQFSARFNLPADADPRVYDAVARFAGDHLRAACDSGP
ncbi:MAG: transglutaminase domain-containing protein [Deltaproteobacteria bacterium]|nr:transglutaminase domain-containing protein [Deltaproteobacteria bacterium]